MFEFEYKDLTSIMFILFSQKKVIISDDLFVYIY